jgi:hypothetical protein
MDDNRFNYSLIPKNDDSLDIVNHKFGRETLPFPHPCLHEKRYTTIARDSFRDPRRLPKSTNRTMTSIIEDSFDPNMRESIRGKSLIN